MSRSICLGLLGLTGLDDCLLPEGPPWLPRRQAAHVLQGRDRPDAVALLHDWGEDRGLCSLRLRLPALLRHIHRQPLVRHMWPDVKNLDPKWEELDTCCIFFCYREKSILCSSNISQLAFQQQVDKNQTKESQVIQYMKSKFGKYIPFIHKPF